MASFSYLPGLTTISTQVTVISFPFRSALRTVVGP